MVDSSNHVDPPLPAADSALEHRIRLRVALPLLLALVLVPPVASLLGETFYIGVASRILIYALAATSLNLILGFGGMVSFGHAAFVGVGAYTVGILMQAGIVSGWIAWPAAFLAGGLFALVIGLVCLRTRGVYFIMITLAFAQMLFYLMVSMEVWGGEDGLSLASRSELGLGLDLLDNTQFYYVVLAVSVLTFILIARLLNARFGHVLQAARENETRMEALGYTVFRYRLIAFALAGAIAGLAGALLANHAIFVSPSTMHWTQSGILLVMVIFGGMHSLWGGFIGAVVFLVIEDIATIYTTYWHLVIGVVLLAVVLLAPNGIASLFSKTDRAHKP